MSIRMKVIFIIVLMAIMIIVFAIGTGQVFVRGNLERTIENDMYAVASIADSLITTEIDLLKADATTVARHIIESSENDLPRVLREQVKAYDKFIGLTIIDRSGIVMAYGIPETPEMVRDSEYIPRAFAGESVISTTKNALSGELVFSVCVPMEGRVLSVTVPGLFFSGIISRFKIWETGSIFIVDKAGTLVANVHDDFVLERYNFVEKAKTDNKYRGLGYTISRMTEGRPGAGRYVFDDVERLCVYRPITGSRVGWAVGVAAPLEESPIRNVRVGLLVVGLVSFGLSVVVAFFASNIIARPYQKISALAETLKTQAQDLAAAREEAVASTEAKSDFLANMSHEMRTPLNAIIGFSELTLDSEDLNGIVQENLEKIYNSGVTLLSLINDILDISKIEAGKFELIPVEYHIPSLINDTVTLNIVRIGSKPITFNLNIDESLPSVLVGDELRLKQIFNNLLSNAFKYTHKGSVEWRVSFEQDGDDVWLVSSVKDSGIGIRSEDMKKLFSEYNQVDTKSNRKIDGTGLGLSICKNMAERMGGGVTVESEYGKGSTFTVRVRQGMANSAPIGAEVVKNLKNFHYSDNKRDRSSKLVRAHIPYAKVLVVDDVSTNLDVARGMMKPYGMQVDCVTSGPAAIEAVRKGNVKYNAVFMDHMMPGMDGIEATRIIREEIGTDYARNVPIIALTANAILGNEDMFLNKGFQAFLSKPIDIMRMDAVINHWVRDKDLEKQIAKEARDASQNETDTNAENDSEVDIDSFKLSVDGLNMEQGLKRFGGDGKIYLNVLRSYTQNTPPLLDQMRGYKQKDLSNYAIVAHGIKSSSLSIGANLIGKRAEALELAVKAGDFAFVDAENDDFIKAVQTLLANLSTVLQVVAEKKPKPRKAEPDADALAYLMEACKNFDPDGVENAMNSLESYEYDSRGELVEWIRSQIAVTGFKRIVERLSKEATSA
ncbi:hypothetical protein AGMMS50276_18850 [Synergistales bacterium]|nr:hypothetical protein AGMMS50276_18850 [Synergistales bacterium]